jgi:DNA polymerase III epsilon subunit-like protein
MKIISGRLHFGASVMVNDPSHEFYISVDVETAGPVPSQYSLLAIGACTVTEPIKTFYIELKPVNMQFQPEALRISELSLEKLALEGTEPAEAMQLFQTWVSDVTPHGKVPVFVGFNAPFDWMFVNDYFQRFLNTNPFGHAALDIKSFYMGLARTPWEKTSMRYVGKRYLNQTRLIHHGLQDAIDQAELFRKMLAESRDKSGNQT